MKFCTKVLSSQVTQIQRFNSFQSIITTMWIREFMKPEKSRISDFRPLKLHVAIALAKEHNFC